MVSTGSRPLDHLLLKKVRSFHHLTLEGQLCRSIERREPKTVDGTHDLKYYPPPFKHMYFFINFFIFGINLV